jgi:hypothetical protein
MKPFYTFKWSYNTIRAWWGAIRYCVITGRAVVAGGHGRHTVSWAVAVTVFRVAAGDCGVVCGDEKGSVTFRAVLTCHAAITRFHGHAQVRIRLDLLQS